MRIVRYYVGRNLSYTFLPTQVLCSSRRMWTWDVLVTNQRESFDLCANLVWNVVFMFLMINFNPGQHCYLWWCNLCYVCVIWEWCFVLALGWLFFCNIEEIQQRLFTFYTFVEIGGGRVWWRNNCYKMKTYR